MWNAEERWRIPDLQVILNGKIGSLESIINLNSLYRGTGILEDEGFETGTEITFNCIKGAAG